MQYCALREKKKKGERECKEEIHHFRLKIGEQEDQRMLGTSKDDVGHFSSS